MEEIEDQITKFVEKVLEASVGTEDFVTSPKSINSSIKWCSIITDYIGVEFFIFYFQFLIWWILSIYCRSKRKEFCSCQNSGEEVWKHTERLIYPKCYSLKRKTAFFFDKWGRFEFL